ncbi:MAG: DUF4389 domain-containing protein [Bacteroidetes bacterium]|nr:DUF4389 domain-containing protein [Bacteroidota bacterium]
MYPAIILLPQPDRSSRLLLLLRPVLAIPHLFWSLLYGLGAGILHFLSFWSIVFTGRHPKGLWNMLLSYFCYSVRLQAWMLWLTDRYPPFTGAASSGHPVAVRIVYPERMSRATVFFRMLLLFPHLFFVIGYTFLCAFVQFLTWWTILFLGRMTDWQYRYIASYCLYTLRLNAYILLLVDEYPPFNGAQPRAVEVRFA